MSLYTGLCAELLFPLHERLKGHDSVARRRQLERSQWLGTEALQALQLARLRSFLQDVGAHVPYYRELFASLGLRPAELTSLADLQRLPRLDKPLIRAHQKELVADDHGPLSRYNTGGSSGEPLIFFMGKARKSHDVAAKWRATRWWGVDIGDREAVVWGSPIELGAQDRVRRLRDGLMRSHLLPAFEMSERNLDSFVAQLRALRPAMLFGYPSSLSAIAAHARRKRIDMRDLGIKVAFVTSERLYDEQRVQISEAFACPVANGYGARDAGFIAHQCPAGSLHISAEDIIVETLSPDGRPVAPGEIGEIVVTHMATRDFPFIRYRTGDMGVLGQRPCGCGRSLPVLQEVHGRSTDFVVAHDGTVMHGLALIYTVRDLPGVEKFRIEQLSLDKTQVKVMCGAGFEPTHVQRIVHDFQRRLGAQVEVDVQLVDDIPAEASGKFRYVISHVKAFAADAQA
ncbi:phenylacetate--CoA ligase family protein [Paucibacter sediminis]|uniref:Phenylacetate--CoA ligase family protein n=1 Tax=Paucibacter sediminis TaxID=3019553 RepID=A0AA95N9W9_9BURK|nr:phenylacetate--CoA ligase family protein [Paucibacter sp. S2-9]WIT11340.1 phenylacetate--CoA ligase family protein [Paucibacter sp. S2-9]